MREEFESFLQTVHKGTTLDELAENCQTEQELELALKKAGEAPCDTSQTRVLIQIYCDPDEYNSEERGDKQISPAAETRTFKRG